MNHKHIIIPIFIPHKGCPFDCIYCNQKIISGQIEEMSLDKMQSIIKSHLSTAHEESTIEIGFYGGSFTGIETSMQIEYLKAANEYINEGRVHGIRLSTRPDYIDDEILTYLVQYGVRTIELGVQSLDEDVLRMTYRGHTAHHVKRSSQLIKEYDIELGIQTMIGLPGSNDEKDYDTAKAVVELMPSIVRIYPTLVVKNTYLEKMYREGTYQPLELDAAVELCAKNLDLYEQHGIKVIRIGLQPTENINDHLDVVAGPFHPAFRQLVESKRMLNKIETYIEGMQIKGPININIYVHPKNISTAVGQKRKNIELLKRKYGFMNIIVKGDPTLKLPDMVVKVETF